MGRQQATSAPSTVASLPLNAIPGSHTTGFDTSGGAIFGGCSARRSPLPTGISSRRGNVEAVIIYDWDDTLMCSSALNAGQLSQQQAQQLEPLIEQALTQAMRLGDTYIVTNADELWVSESSRRFAPRVQPILSHLPIISARRKWEHAYPGNVFAWKREAFREVVGSRMGNGVSGLNLVALGDSPAEMEAAQTSTQ